MIRAIVKKGGLELLDPISTEFPEGQEVRFKLVPPADDPDYEPSEEEMQDAMDFLNDPANAMSEEDFKIMMERINLQRQIEKEAMRKMMDLMP